MVRSLHRRWRLGWAGQALAIPTHRPALGRVGSISERGPVPLTAPAARGGPRSAVRADPTPDRSRGLGEHFSLGMAYCLLREPRAIVRAMAMNWYGGVGLGMGAPTAAPTLPPRRVVPPDPAGVAKQGLTAPPLPCPSGSRSAWQVWGTTTPANPGRRDLAAKDVKRPSPARQVAGRRGRFGGRPRRPTPAAEIWLLRT